MKRRMLNAKEMMSDKDVNASLAKAKRYKSCEDLSDHDQSVQQCWKVFDAFVHVNKTSKDSSIQHTASGDQPSDIAAADRDKRQEVKRQRSEPIGCATRHVQHSAWRTKDVRNDASEQSGSTINRSKPLNVTEVRPCSLGLDAVAGASSNTTSLHPHRSRRTSNSSSDKGCTPVSDPLFSPTAALPVASAIAETSDIFETYPPLRRPNCEAQLHHSAHTHHPVPHAWSSSVLVAAGTPESLNYLCGPSSLPNDGPPLHCHTGPPCLSFHSHVIAERLKVIGDAIEREHSLENYEIRLEEVMTHVVLDSNGTSVTQYINILTEISHHLTWPRISEIFSAGYFMFEKCSSILGDPNEDVRWGLFQKLWETTVSIVARWIRDNGGWGAFLRWNERTSMPPRSPHSNDEEPLPRPRLWSLSEAGSLVDEDGITLLEASMEHGEQQGDEGECSSDFEGSVGMNSTVFTLDEDPFQSTSVPPANLHGSLEGADDLCDSGVTSSVEQLSVSPYESMAHLSHMLSASASSPSLPCYQCSPRSRVPAVRRVPSCGTYGSGHAPPFSDISPFERNRSKSLPRQRRGQRPPTLPPRPASERAMDELVYPMNVGVGTAFFYTIVSHFLNK